MPRPLAIALESLDQLKSALKIVVTLGDGAIGVPALRAAAGTAIEIIEIAQVHQQGRSLRFVLPIQREGRYENKQDARAREVAKSALSVPACCWTLSKVNPRPIYRWTCSRTSPDMPKSLNLCKNLAQARDGDPPLAACPGSNLRQGRDQPVQRYFEREFSGLRGCAHSKPSYASADLLGQLQACIIAQAPVQPRLSAIRREELDLLECWRLDALSGVVSAECNGNRVVVKKYGADKKQWVCDSRVSNLDAIHRTQAADIDSLLQSDAW
ncbi:hypothetical protein FB451DRAFT_678553 [Mycena latifolia]|nr:hypothetical protein FB451DRAFT_678553 [Mycena latifolia]